MKRFLALIAAVAMMAAAPVAVAGDCSGFVAGVRPVSQYNHAAGRGFLAVRTGPGSGYAQLGELYLGDEVAVWDRAGKWYYIHCASGRCLDPYWGEADPSGWVHGRYLRIDGYCP